MRKYRAVFSWRFVKSDLFLHCSGGFNCFTNIDVSPQRRRARRVFSTKGGFVTLRDSFCVLQHLQ